MNFRIAFWPLGPWTQPWTRDHKRACVNCFYNLIPASHYWCLGVPPSPLLHSSVVYYRTYYCCRVIIFVLQNLHTEDDTFTTVRTAALSYCPVIFLIFWYLVQRIQHQFVFVRHTGRQLAYFGSAHEAAAQRKYGVWWGDKCHAPIKQSATTTAATRAYSGRLLLLRGWTAAGRQDRSVVLRAKKGK